jgi:HK97 gp10 family phage protein
MSSDTNISGGRQLDEFLKTLAPNVEKKILRVALAAGARVFAKETKQRAPSGPTSTANEVLYGGYEGALRDSVRVTSGFNKKGFVYASVKAGGRTKKGADVFYAHLVEFGARPHVIRPRGKKRLQLGGQFIAGTVMHPGMQGKPFMRPAADAAQAAAVAAVAAKIRERLTKQGIDVPTPGDE